MLSAEVERLVAAQCRSTYWRDEDARLIVGALADSGMTLGAFARHFGVSAKRVGRWRARLTRTPCGQPDFHPVRVVPPLTTLLSEDCGDLPRPFEVRLRGGRSVLIPERFDDASVARLVRLLETLPC